MYRNNPSVCVISYLKYVMTVFFAFLPCLALANEGIISHYDNGKYVLNPDKTNTETWEKLALDKNLQTISFMSFHSWSITPEQIRSLEELTHIQSIVLIGCKNVNVELLTVLKKLPKLHSLAIFYCQHYSNEVYNELASMTNLDTLSINGELISVKGMVCLSKMVNLTQLEIDTSTEVSLQQIEALQNLKNLRILVIKNVPISDFSLQLLGKIHSLKELYLCGFNQGSLTSTFTSKPVLLDEHADRQTEAIPAFPSNFIPVTERGIQGLASLKNLQVLALSLPSATTKGELESLFTLSSLKRLALCGVYRDVDINNIQKLTNLQELYLGSSFITGAALKPLAKLQQLREIKLEFAPDAPEVSKELALLSPLKLRLISLSGNACVSNLAVDALSKYLSLEYIDLYDTDVTSDGINELARVFPNASIFPEPERSESSESIENVPEADKSDFDEKEEKVGEF